MGDRERDSNIELLRIIAICGVIVLHINNPQSGGLIALVDSWNINKVLVYFGESIFIIGVNLFIAISGFYMIGRQKRNIWRVIELLLQVIFFNIIVYIVQCVLTNDIIYIKKVLFRCLPINYFAVLYCALYLISPYLNIIINRLKQKELDGFILLVIILFSIIPTSVDVLSEVLGASFMGLSTVGLYGSQYGYTIVNFIMMYFLGAYLRKRSFEGLRTSRIFLMIIISTLLIMCWAYFNDIWGYGVERTAWEYCNPFVVVLTCMVLLIFNKMKIKNNKIINRCASCTFSVYLLHPYFLKLLDFKAIAQLNPILMLIKIFWIVLIIYVICAVIDSIYKRTFFSLLHRIELKFPFYYSVGDD